MTFIPLLTPLGGWGGFTVLWSKDECEYKRHSNEMFSFRTVSDVCEDPWSPLLDSGIKAMPSRSHPFIYNEVNTTTSIVVPIREIRRFHMVLSVPRSTRQLL